jgi:malate dehydrogenase (quinone)
MKRMTARLFSMAVGLNAVLRQQKLTHRKSRKRMYFNRWWIMSATLGTYLQELEPNWSITMVERLDALAEESSNGWNNAGTGHAALMELNYTRKTRMDQSASKRRLRLTKRFCISRQFWAHQVETGVLSEPRSFINTVPHMSLVWGDDNVNFLRARYKALQQSTLFRGMRYTENHEQIRAWAPLDGRARPAAESGGDAYGNRYRCKFREITRQLIHSLQRKDNFSLKLGSEVRSIKRNADNTWNVTIASLKTAASIRSSRPNLSLLAPVAPR